MWRAVMRPELLRPPDLLSGRTSDFSGVDRVISTKSATELPRRPGVVGLYLRMPIDLFLKPLGPGSAGSAEDGDGALAQRREGALGVLATAQAEARATGLALAVDRAHRRDLDAREDLLDRE